jgi:hypothetical protein
MCVVLDSTVVDLGEMLLFCHAVVLPVLVRMCVAVCIAFVARGQLTPRLVDAGAAPRVMAHQAVLPWEGVLHAVCHDTPK